MTFLPRLILAGLAVFCVAGPAFAYTLFPLNTRSRLSGTLEFINTKQHQRPFRCRVSMTLRTRNPHEGISKFSEVVSAKIVFPSRSCPPDVLFNNLLPFPAGASDGTTAVIGLGGWRGINSCSEAETHFAVNSNGVWTASASGCFAGTLTTNPPITVSP